ncbi:hypothetical protein [Dietzia sp. B32]|uniref:hypothetical protein n=1 Tax=Dietzia sp. B32 TaxID=2915130 RepID=UPI0021AE2798|nr:hypothetical protein [Dietzia sp. B32]UVE95285.1 hypothetical protein L8M95_00220 [Dietzia sp. B32]
MDLTGSIAEFTTPLSAEFSGSLPETGSSAIDTLVGAAFLLPNLLLGLIGSFGADLGSTGGLA